MTFMTLIRVDAPDELHRAVKSAAADRGEKLKDLVVKLLALGLAQLKKG